MKLLVGIPSSRDWKIAFGISIVGLVIYLNKLGIEATVRVIENSLLSQAREEMLLMAINEKFSHLLFVDDDTQFKPEAVQILVDRNKDFCAANQIHKNSEIIPTARGGHGERIYSKGKTGIERITYIGLGFALIKIDAIKDISTPHFEVKWATQGYLSEDHNFCYLLAQNNIELYVDHDASKYVWHIGNYPYQESLHS
jgi:hypothetical protein